MILTLYRDLIGSMTIYNFISHKSIDWVAKTDPDQRNRPYLV